MTASVSFFVVTALSGMIKPTRVDEREGFAWTSMQTIRLRIRDGS